MDMHSFGELYDMPMKRLEKRIPGAKPIKNKRKDSQIEQPSRQVRKMNKYVKILMRSDMVLMALYRLMLFESMVNLVASVTSKIKNFIPSDNEAGYNTSYRYTSGHLDIHH